MKQLSEASEAIRDLYRQRPAEQVGEAQVEKLSLKKGSVYGASQWSLMWRKFKRNRAALIGGLVVLLFYVGALFADFVAPYPLTQRHVQFSFMPPQRVHWVHDGKFGPFVYGIIGQRDPRTLQRIYQQDTEVINPVRFFVRGAPYTFLGMIETDLHLFGVDEQIIAILGTDSQGRDMFSRIMLGSRISLTIGLLGVSLSLVIGTILGVASGYYGGMTDNIIQRLIEVVRAFPAIPLWMALAASLPQHWPPAQTYFAITIILSLIGWTWLARQLRGKVLSIREEAFVMAAQLSGASNSWIIFRHLIPATFSHIIVIATLAMPAMILAESALSFLGLGLRPPLTSWGVLLKEAQNIQALVLYPWLLFPGMFVAASILAFSFLGDGLRDAADPYTI
jgi:peptide/nickel transport system permease protein